MSFSALLRQSARPVRLCLLTSVASLPFATAAIAAEEEAKDQIVVLGTRPIAESEAAALQVQKLSDSLVTVAASDAVGRLPDQNIAQATGRLPGVAVERDQGQARYISLRGGPKTWTTLSFDGVNVISPEGRDSRFDSVPSAIAGKIIVNKAITPEMPGETVAGNVNVVTRSAFDFKGKHLNGKLGYGQQEYGKRPEYESSLVLSDRFDVGGGELGVLLSGSYYERNMVTDNFENDYEVVSQDTRPGYERRQWVSETENKLYRLTRKNWSVSGRVDYKPNDRNTISVRSIYTIFSDDEARDNYRFDLDDKQSSQVAGTAACDTSVKSSYTTSGYADVCSGNTTYAGTVRGIDIRQRNTLRAYKQSIFTNTLEGTHEFDGGWKLNWLGNYTVSKDDRSVVGEIAWESPSTISARPTVAYDFTNPGLSMLTLYNTTVSGSTLSNGAQVVAIDSFAKSATSFSLLDAVDTTKAYTAKAVLSKQAEFLGGNLTLKAGLQFDQRTKTADEWAISVTGSTNLAALGIPTSYQDFSLDQAFMGKIKMGYTFRYFDTAKMRAVAAKARELYARTANSANDYTVREQVYAGFLMGTLRYDWGSILAGVRLEKIKNHGSALGTINSVSTTVNSGSSQLMAFPSVHFNYNVDQTKKLRLTFSTGAARADYDQMRPNVVVNDSNTAISGGNPSIKPERAMGVDAYFEWYMRPSGFISAGLYYKKVSDVLYKSSRVFGSHALDSNGIDRSNYTYTGINNAGNGHLMGLELAVQQSLEPWVQKAGLPEWMGGFGLNANMMLNDSSVTKPASDGFAARKVRLPNTSDMVYNLGGYYEKYGLTLRLQYQYRSMWLDEIADGFTEPGGDTYWDADDELDFSARYAITKNVSVYFDASNLINQPGRRFIDAGGLLTAKGVPTGFSKQNTIEWERFGRRFSGGIRVNF
ncbi:TonB-dependent receptor [Novosphingobium umbonatum]|uniref:TonB-dependent receptor n=1 Tax=Novosphingobium umbonatum TaxID=1908524 RepID=A0A3S2Y931_9SPHN|nr:TonB-dependent receptor [Novosphingobium umbonatum]RVU06319.1 TonB-dependent receptor [Novosphingobium umbonatum]